MTDHKPKRDIMDRLLDWDEVATRSICTDEGGCFRCEAHDEIQKWREIAMSLVSGAEQQIDELRTEENRDVMHPAWVEAWRRYDNEMNNNG